MSEPEVTWSVRIPATPEPESRFRIRPVSVGYRGSVSWIVERRGRFFWSTMSECGLSKEEASKALDELRKEERK